MRAWVCNPVANSWTAAGLVRVGCASGCRTHSGPGERPGWLGRQLYRGDWSPIPTVRSLGTRYTTRRCNDSPSALCAPARRAAQSACRPVPPPERWNEGQALLEDAPSRRGRRPHGVAARAGVCRPGPSVVARCMPSLALGPGTLPGRRRQSFPSCAPGGGRRGSDAVRGLMRHQPWGLNTSSRVWASRIRSAQDSSSASPA